MDENILEFNRHILELSEKGNIGVIDVIVEYCESNDIDYDEINDMLLSKLRHKIKEEAVSRNLMKGHKRLV